MLRTLLALLLTGLWGTLDLSAATAGCPIRRATVAGSNIWLLCGRSELLVSLDGGKTWQTRRAPDEANFRALAFLDSRRGFLVGDRGTVLATEDGAETWRRIPLPNQQNLTSIHFTGELGWITGWSGIILHSPDGGRTWKEQPSGVLQGLESIYFADAKHGWAVGWVGSILRTVNGGESWEKVKMQGTFWSLDSVFFSDTRRGWAVGFGGQVMRSRDGGVTWDQQRAPAQAWLTSVMFDAGGRGWIAAGNLILASDDGGESWHSIEVGDRLFIHQVIPVQDSVWAVGQFGILNQSGPGPAFRALPTLPSTNRALSETGN